MKRTALALVGALACAAPAAAQTNAELLETQKQRIVERYRAEKLDPFEMGKLLSPRGNLRTFLLFAQLRSNQLDLSRIEDARIDKQVGAPANMGGSTSAVSKGAVPSILGLAVENGALTQIASGTTVTFRGNLVGWVDLVHNQGFIAAYQDDSRLVRQLRRLSYSFTLNTDSTAEEAAPEGLGGFSPDALREQLRRTQQQLAGYSVRLALWDRRDPRAAPNRAAVANLLDTKGVQLLGSTNFLDPVFNSDEYDVWLNDAQNELVQPGLDEAQVRALVDENLEELRLLMLDRIPNLDEQVGQALLAYGAFEESRLSVFQAMQKQPLVAVEYVNARAPALPQTSTVRLIAEGQLGPRMDLTANIAWTFQHAGMVQEPTPRDVEGMRDFQAAAQLEIPLRNAAARLKGEGGVGVPSIAVAYLSQKLSEKAAVAFAGHSFTVEPGWIHLVQAKLTLPLKGVGVKVPLSVSLANRSELLEEKTIRGHIGLTFDLDVLSALRR